MFLAAALALAAAILCIAYYIVPQFTDSPSLRLPPGPTKLPVFGNLLDLIRLTFYKGEAPFYVLAQWAFSHGPLCYLRFGTQRVVVVSDARIAQQMCVGQADTFSERPSSLFLARVLKDKGIVFNDGPSWKEHRMFISQEFRKYGFGHHSVEQQIQYVIDEYVQQVAKKNGQFHDPHLDLATAIYNIIWKVISGDQFKWDDPFLRQLIHNLETNLEAVELVGVHNYVLICSLLHLMWHNPFRLLSIINKRFSYFNKLIASAEDNNRNNDDKNESMIHDYLMKMKNSKAVGTETHFSEKQLLWLVSDLFIAGGETTITTLRWMILSLASFPDIQERIRQEIKDSMGMDATPTYSQRTQLPYSEAFIHEVLRICGVTPGMWRSTSADAVVQGYDIPKGTWILLHFWAMSNNSSQWEDVHQFRPERFLNDDGTFRKDENLLAFSAGRRQCPGEALARTELYLFLTSILQKYRVSLPGDRPIPSLLDGNFGVTYTPPDFQVSFTLIE